MNDMLLASYTPRLMPDTSRTVAPRAAERADDHEKTVDRSGPTERMRLLHVAIHDFLSNNLPPR